MKDGILAGTGNSRFLKSVEDFKDRFPNYESFANALVDGNLPIDLNGINPDGWEQTGTPLNKRTLLSEEVVELLGLSGEPTVSDALKKLATPKGELRVELGSYVGNGKTDKVTINSTLRIACVVLSRGATSDVSPDSATSAVTLVRDAPAFFVTTISSTGATTKRRNSLTWGDSEVSWAPATSGATDMTMFNRSGETYRYVIIGGNYEAIEPDDPSKEVVDDVARAGVEALEIRASALETRVSGLEKRGNTDPNLECRVANLEAAADGYLYREETDSTEAYTKTVPPGALPWATLDSFGGRSIRWNQAFNGAERPGSYNQTRLNRIENGDGSFTYELLSIDKSSSGTYTHTCRIRNIEVVPGNVYGHFYRVKVSRNSKVAVGTSTWTESVAVPADGEFHRVGFVATRTSSTDFFMGFTYGQQGELEIGDSFTIRDWMYFDLTEMFGAGNEPTREQFDAMFPDDYYPYAPGETKKAEITSVVSSAGSSIPIPETIRSLPGYGETGSLVDFTNGRYTAPDGTETDISTLLPDNALKVEAGGTVIFANENHLPVPNQVSYLIKTTGGAY